MLNRYYSTKKINSLVMDRPKNSHIGIVQTRTTPPQGNVNRQQQQPIYDHRYHFHITERPISSVKYMDKKAKSILCNSNGIIVAEMVYRCLICKNIFETPLDCRSHFNCFHNNEI